MTRARRLAGANTPASSPSHPAASRDAPRAPEPRPGRIRARLPLLPALALLLGALSLFHAAPAAAQGLAAPTNIQLAAGDASLTLTWDATSYTVTGGAVRWRVKDTDPNTAGNQAGSWAPVAQGGTMSLADRNNRNVRMPYRTCTTNTGIFCVPLTNGVTYEVEFSLQVSSQTTGWVSAGDGTPVAAQQTTAPAAPTNLSVSPGDGKLDLTWTAPSGTVTGYDVHYTSSTTVAADAAAVSSVTAGWVAHTRSSSLTTATHSVTPLTNGTPYRVRVRAKNAAGDGPWLGHDGTHTPNAHGTVWQAMLNPQQLPTGFGIGCLNGAPASAQKCSTETTLTDADFVVGGVTGQFNVTAVQLFADGTLSVNFTVAPSMVANFCVGSTAFAFSDGSITGGIVRWSNSGLTWTPGTPESLSVGASCPQTQTVTPTPSTDADLTALSVSSATASDGSFTDLTLTPVFDTDTTEYTASVANAQTHAKLAWTLSDSNATVKVGKGTSLTTTTAAASGAIELAVGANALKVEVTAEDGSTMATYTVTVTRAAAQQATVPDAPTNLLVAPGDARLGLTWDAPMGTLTGYDVHYTSALATGSNPIGDDAGVTQGLASAGWVAVSRTEADPPTASQSITGLTNTTPYRVRVRAKNSAGNSAWVFGAGTPTSLTTVTLTVMPNPVAEGSSVTVSAARSATAGEVTIPISVTLGTAETADLDATNLALLRTGLGFNDGTATSSATVATEQDADAADETFTVAIDTANLPTGYAAGATTSVAVTIADDETKPTVTFESPTLTVTEGSTVNLRMTRTGGPADSTIPITVDLGTAETGDLDSDSLALLRLGFGFTEASTTSSSVSLGTEQDADEDDETFTVAIDTAKLAELGYDAGTVASVTVTIVDDDGMEVSLSVAPNPVEEGSDVTVTATLSHALPNAVSIPVVLTDDSAESGDHGALTAIAVAANATTGTGTITTVVDEDVEDETFTVALGTPLPAGYEAGSANSVEVTIEDSGTFTLEIFDGDEELLIGPGAGLGDSSDTRPRWVQVPADLQHATLTPSWSTLSTGITGVSASVRYVAHGMDGGTLAWSSNENGRGKELELYSPLGSPGYPKLTITFGSDTYTIYFQNNSEWKFHNDALKRLRMRIHTRSDEQ